MIAGVDGDGAPGTFHTSGGPVFLREHADITGCQLVLPRRAQAVQVRLVTGHLIACFAITAFAFHVAWLKTGPALASDKLR